MGSWTARGHVEHECVFCGKTAHHGRAQRRMARWRQLLVNCKVVLAQEAHSTADMLYAAGHDWSRTHVGSFASIACRLGVMISVSKRFFHG